MNSKTPRKVEKPKILTPLWVISLFVSLTETMTGIAATQTNGGVQVALTCFVIAFPTMVAAAFFAILWWKPYVLYSPTEFGGADVSAYVEAMQRKGDIQAAALMALPDVVERGAKAYGSKPEEFVRFIREQIRKVPEFQPLGVPEAGREVLSLDGRSILWVDDNPMNNVYETDVLKRLGATIDFVTSTAEGLQLLRRKNYDLIVSDVHRVEAESENPNAGYDLLDAIRKMGKPLKVVFYTGDVSRLDQKRAKGALGAADRANELIDLALNALATD